MHHLILALDLISALLLMPWFGLLALVVAAATWRRLVGRQGLLVGPADSSRFLIVIPAHDEAGVIGITVHSCLALDYNHDRFQVAVIADNCTDDTAAEAEAAGAIVIRRATADRRSKGYALEDFFSKAIGSAAIWPCDAFVLVDADTNVDPGLLHAFDQSLRQGDDFIQGYYTVRNADAAWRTRLRTYAFSLANGVWLAGIDQLGLSIGLKGNGMCFRAAALERFPWRAHGLVEDMEFAWHLRIAGERVRWQPAARVFGELVSRGGTGAASQRHRWEKGRAALRASFRRAIGQSRHLSPLAKLLSWTELEFPPLSRLVAGLILATVLGGWGWSQINPDRWESLYLGFLLACWLLIFGYLAAPFWVVALPVRYASALLHAPLYMAWKATLGAMKTPRKWVRTPREQPPTHRMSPESPSNATR